MSEYNLSVFDAWQDARCFLADVIESLGVPAETESLLRQSLVAGAENLHYLIECTESLRRRPGADGQNLHGQDALAYVWDIFNGVDSSASVDETGGQIANSIAQAKILEPEPDVPSPSITPSPSDGDHDEVLSSPRPPTKPMGRVTASHYWSDHSEEQCSKQSRKRSSRAHLSSVPFASQTYCRSKSSVLPKRESAASLDMNNQAEGRLGQNHGAIAEPLDLPKATPIVRRASIISPYFSSTAPTEKKSPAKKKPPPGTVATVPFAPLRSTKFGIIQEEFADDPFWLLVAVTFLIKTNGKLAIPMFYKVRERFPSPEQVADSANAEELIGMIRHLGLSVVRVAFMQKYARGFLEDPPRANVRYKIKNYDCRDINPQSTLGTSLAVDEPFSSSQGTEDLEEWEIGHLTKGKYAIDSWRIFCRDRLLGRAEDWNGKGREPEFQPEWMRVMPADKELRAYLRWMWMREGWEWEPATGERTVLREEMLRAVNEGRVEYDDTGGLRILDESNANSSG
ncbi:hypothetical protein EDB81DRAFT_777255 [Dactylonectria macrodidyma]|uniref:Methyl-CpG-binding domain-containing protein 4 n=1 Tax=Dactylonectria macrodidyma TaxID=307937 RepID=A0A9P9FRD0_9HYPO|nr:hypothetical protein EDB81DRAFT_777255 [Dactylonectria macrodidyma]